MNRPEFMSCNQPSLDQQFTKHRFEDKVAVVSGGASGIGFAVAERFANDGAIVAVIDINQENIKKATAHFEGIGLADRIRFYTADISDKLQVQSVVDSIGCESGQKIHFLVNSAAYFGSQGLKSEPIDWKRSLDVNVVGTANLVQACHFYMKAVNGAAIVNITSISAIRAQPNRWTYSATKGALKTITRNMALDLAPDNIRVNSVGPGWIWTPEGAKASPDGTFETLDKTVRKFHMLKRHGRTSEVAAAVTFLCSRDASFITGTNLMVDGGYSAMGPERHGEESMFAGCNE